MGRRTCDIFVALLMLATSSSFTINPSSTTFSDSINPSSTSCPIINSGSTSSSVSNPSSTFSSLTVKPASTTSGFTTKPSSTTSFGFLSPKPSSSYQVTENVIDTPDNRPLPPIFPNFGLVKPLNVANTTITVNKVTKNDTGDENNEIKKTSFTYVHFNQDTEKKKEKEENGIRKLFRGIRDYVFNLKKGVVDGLHSYFYRSDRKKDKGESFYDTFHRSNDDFGKNDEIDFHHKFHRGYHSDENFDDYEYGIDEVGHEFKDLND